MDEHAFGKGGPEVPRIGQGTWRMERDDRAGALAALKAGLDAGLTHLDTAELYGSGCVEELVAEAIAGRRDQVFLVSKVTPTHAARQGVLSACDHSLQRLRTDRLDCYLLHWPSSHPLEETLAGLAELKRAGKIRSYGVSNFDEELLAEAARLAGPGEIACDQVLYNLHERHVEARVLPACERLGVALVGYSPFAHFPPKGKAQRKVLDEIAQARELTAHQVALAFLTREPLLFAIPKAAKAAHARENAKAGDVKLSKAEIARLDAAFPLSAHESLPTA